MKTSKWAEWQAIAKDETNWQSAEELGLTNAEYRGGYLLRIWFKAPLGVKIYDLDFAPLLVEENPGPALLPLRDPARFQTVNANYTLIWPNPQTGSYDSSAIDLAPECIRFFCERYGTVVNAES
ncbi:MAG: hypothetical protein WBG32_10950 [Nodosilinea sp.]